MAHIKRRRKLNSTNRDDTSKNYLVNIHNTVLEDQLVELIVKKGVIQKEENGD